MNDILSAARLSAGDTSATRDFIRTESQTESVIRESAQEFEAVFLTEMLKHAGLGQMPEIMNGGVGEAAFADFLTREYAMSIAQDRSIGIADHVYGTLMKEGQV